ncbi:Hypothetical predicted protein [Scomber scombrus]|uniref:Uncharacterized protein n=1 Tax=Scomber scombrus TaxID=13677 RepID=A0AAV1NI83_SCOSC
MQAFGVKIVALVVVMMLVSTSLALPKPELENPSSEEMQAFGVKIVALVVVMMLISTSLGAPDRGIENPSSEENPDSSLNTSPSELNLSQLSELIQLLRDLFQQFFTMQAFGVKIVALVVVMMLISTSLMQAFGVKIATLVVVMMLVSTSLGAPNHGIGKSSSEENHGSSLNTNPSDLKTSELLDLIQLLKDLFQQFRLVSGP